MMMTNFHFHGSRTIDFSTDLVGDQWLNKLTTAIAEIRTQNELAVPTIFMRRKCLANFESLCLHFAQRVRTHPDNPILGFGIEGPVIASRGGTPSQSQWQPTMEEWERIARLGPSGLLYCVISFDESADLELTRDVFNLLGQHGVAICPGHFKNVATHAILEQIEIAVDVSRQYGQQILTDHLFNDMPLNVKHSWRNSECRIGRVRYLAELRNRLHGGSMTSLRRELGDVPARLIELNRSGDATLCINFDGAHVDLGLLFVLKEFMATSGIIAMTDQVRMPLLCGNRLVQNVVDTLYYNADGAVSAGSSSMVEQAFNLAMMGYSESDIQIMTGKNCLRFASSRLLASA